MNSVIKNIYLYDFAFCDVFATTNLLIFGYLYEQQQWRKVELLVQNFDITLALSVDCNIFKSSSNKSEVTTMVENYLYSANNKQKLKDLVLDYKELVGFLPFKGAQSVQNNQKIAEFEFRSFKEYDAFQRKINNINENIIDKFKNTKEAIDDYIIGTLFKEFVYLHQFILNEQSQYSKGQVQNEILNDILELFDSQPNKCSTLLEIAHIQIRSNEKYSKVLNEVDAFLDQLKRKCTYTPNLSKYPFRILENDSKNNYILKLLRHSNCQLSGFNKVTLSNNPKIPEDPTQRIHLTCNSLQDIQFDSTFEPNTNPLTLLAWDIEVCTQTGKFDNDGTNDQNKVLCIGMSYGLIQQGVENKQRIGVCITWVDSADNQLDLIQFIDLYRGYLRNPIAINLQSQYVVRSVNESQMIKDFFSLINLFDPSFITGFNDFQFDFPFIKDKISTFGAKGVQNNIQELLQRGFTFKSNNDLFHSQSIKINASDNKAGISLDVRGIISIDTRILLMKTQKLEKKSLNDYLLANNLPVKLDVSFRDMNKAFKTIISGNQVIQINTDLFQQQRNDTQMITVNDLKIDTQPQRRPDLSGQTISQMDNLTAKQILSDVFKYCMYDSEACCLLWQKRSILQQSVEVSKLSFTPLKYAFLNADGIKVRNMVAKFAFDRKFCVPMTNSSHDIRLRDIECLNKYEKYPGAYVSPPKKGISTTPVSALDFESLYPSIIMAHNLSPEKVIEPFEIIPYSTKTTQIGIPFEKGDMKEVLEGNVLTRESGVGIYPEILKYLFDSRKQVKKQMEHIAEQADSTNDPIVKKELEFQTTLLNCKQLAIKVFMNTFYGETGNQKSPLFDVLISGGTTTLGQKYIRQVHSFIEEQDCEIVYGDSILGDEPLLLRDEHNLINIKTIESLMFNSAIRDYGMSKEQSPSNYQIWVYDKWVPIKRVIRHKVAKDIYRVTTGNSMIEVTEDHSLINTKFKQIKPVDCDVLDTKILQGFPKIQDSSNLKNYLTKLQKTKLYIMGLLFDYKQEIPQRVLNAPKFMKKLFLTGVLQGKLQVTDNQEHNEEQTTQNTLAHGHQTDTQGNQNNKLIAGSVVCNSKLMAQQIYFLIYQIGYHPSIESLKNNKYLVSLSNNPVRYSNMVIGVKKMKQYKVQYVYDIETDLGMFGAGIGQMTLKNTDSVYFRPRFSHFALYKQQKELELRQTNISVPNSITYNEINDISADMLQSAYDATERLKVEINKRIGEQTSGFLKLAFEELLYPSMFTGKKKYCGVVYVPGKMTVKSKLTIKDILLRGIDFIKSQYPQIIKQVGQQTLINIMEHFMLNIRGFNADQLQEIFKDTYRDNLNTQLKDLVQSQILNLNTRLLSIQPQEYQLLASKKKLRSTKTGQMMLFRQRLVDIDDQNRAFIFNSLKEIVLQIDISELQQSGIDVPEDGEILDLISVNPPSTMPKLKASELIHLLQYAQQRKLPINIREYLKMYRTTASRILVSAFFDNSINDPDEQEKQALKQAKKFCDECQMPIISEKESLLNNLLPVVNTKQPERYLYLISILEETRIKLDNLVQNCINKAHIYSCNTDTYVDKQTNIVQPTKVGPLVDTIGRLSVQLNISDVNLQIVSQDQVPSFDAVNRPYRDHLGIVRPLVIDQEKLLSYIYQYLTVNPRRSSTLHVLCNLDQIKLKLEFCLEQSIISGTDIQLQQYIDYIEKLILEYQESHLLLVIFRLVVLLQHQTTVKLSVEQIKSFISRMIYIQHWKGQYAKLMGFIARYNKIPSEMSESYNWLFKQKTVYIELSKVINKKSDVKNIETASKDIQLPIPEFFDIPSVINSLLIQKSDIIKKFFEESIWDLEYQQFKKNPIQQTKWANEQVDLYKKGILKQMHILKIMKVWPEIRI